MRSYANVIDCGNASIKPERIYQLSTKSYSKIISLSKFVEVTAEINRKFHFHFPANILNGQLEEEKHHFSLMSLQS